MKFLVETSARHVHVTQEHLEILFGKGYELTKKKDLSQPGQFACEERVTLVGPKKELKNEMCRRDRPTSTQIILKDLASWPESIRFPSILRQKPWRKSQPRLLWGSILKNFFGPFFQMWILLLEIWSCLLYTSSYYCINCRCDF